LYNYRTREELQRFIDIPIPQIKFEPRTPIDEALRKRERDDSDYSGSLYHQLKARLRAMSIGDWLKFREKSRALNSRLSDPMYDDKDENTVGWRFTKHAIEYMAYL
jgi:hypothetical protein